MWPYAYVIGWLYGCVKVWPCGVVIVWLCRYVLVRLCGCMNVVVWRSGWVIALLQCYEGVVARLCGRAV